MNALVTILALSTAIARQSDIEEHPGARLPAEVSLTDQDNKPVKLGDYFKDGKPVVVVLAYFRCPMLCDVVLRGVAQSLARQPLELGRDYRALTISFDPRDRPAEASLKQHNLLQAINRSGDAAAWPFLVGREPAVRAIADRLGFEYAWDPTTQQFAHPAVAFVMTPDGRVSRYLYGVTFRPLDMRLALGEAAGGRIGGIVDRVLLTCFRYDPASRRYAPYVSGVLKGGAAITLLLVGGALAAVWRRERRRGVA